MMCDDDELPRALQNHLVHVRHLTTLPALWMPQYAHAWAGSSTLHRLAQWQLHTMCCAAYSSSARIADLPLAPPTGMLAMLSMSSSS
jgi:hypothetical protein